MDDAPSFFLPYAEPDKQESAYQSLAEIINRPVPDAGKRIYSITFRHNGEEWTATVGQKLHGTKTRETRSKGKKRTSTTSLQDDAMVLAIFSGTPYLVCTDGGNNSRSLWENPFFAGQPHSVTYFEQ
jgi:hypothetical protein